MKTLLSISRMVGCMGASCLPFLLVACNLANLSPVALETLSIKAEPDANLSSAVSVDVLLAYQAPLYAKLKGMTAQTYYATVEQLRRDHDADLKIWHWEIVPGQQKAYCLAINPCGAVGAVLYADFKTQGTHRADIGHFPKIAVHLTHSGFRLSREVPSDLPVEIASPASLESPLIQHPLVRSSTPESSLKAKE